MVNSHFNYITKLSIGKCFGRNDNKASNHNLFINFYPQSKLYFLAQEERLIMLQEEKIKKEKERKKLIRTYSMKKIFK